MGRLEIRILRTLNWRGRANPFSVWSVAGNSKRVSLNPKRGHHLKLRMLFEWAKEPLSHYPLGSQDYTRIDFSCNIMKYECEVLREETELKGDVHPIQCLINAWEWVRWTQLMHLKLRKLLCLDELTIRLVATIRWASILYRVWFQNKEWKRNDHWNLRHKTSIP